MYTSGTTGPPKGVVVSRRAIAADIDALAEAWQWTPEDTLVHGLPLFHVHGLVLGLLGSLRIGNRFVHTGKPTPAGYAAAQRVAVLRRADGVVAGRRRPRRRRGVVVGAAAGVRQRAAAGAGVRQARRTHRASAGRAIRQHRNVDHAEHPGGRRATPGLGRVCHWPVCRPGWCDDDGSPAPHDGETIGRLQVRGPTLFDGYLNRPDATAEAFDADGWYRTGDAAVIDDGGMHRIVGRESVDLIKSGGYRVGAGEVEAALLGHPGVAEAAVVGLPDDDLGQRIVAFVVGDAEPDALIDYVAQQLSVHKRPA